MTRERSRLDSAQQRLLDAGFPYGRLNYWKSSLTDELSEEVIAALVETEADMVQHDSP